MTQTTTLEAVRSPARARRHFPLSPRASALQSFELMQRAANLLASSTLVPAAYRKVIEKLDRYGNVKESRITPTRLRTQSSR
ncbi:hypothetical protein [Burkholderia glumae]|uniref:hypothetical protein n=1 Tax=Burkholderia glumae TaxID=337 RepID=UPI001F23F455|nr:hypothetical protein [Burkholderia glumae]